MLIIHEIVLIWYYTVQLFNDLLYIFHDYYEYTIILFIEYYNVLCIFLYSNYNNFYIISVIYAKYIFL